VTYRTFIRKPLPAKGYVRANFFIRQSQFHPEVRYLHLIGKQFVDAYIVGGYGAFVAFSTWLKRNTDHDQRQKLISMLSFGTLGKIEVRLWPSAFPRIYGTPTYQVAPTVTIHVLKENYAEPQTLAV
jgi:hypothetical protein